MCGVMCVPTCGGQRLALEHQSVLYILRQGMLCNLELTDLARSANHQALGIHLHAAPSTNTPVLGK